MVRIAAILDKEKSILNNDKTPSVKSTSWESATTAPKPNCQSNLSQIYISIAIREKDTAWKPFHNNSELIVGPTNSVLLNSNTLSPIKLLTLIIVFLLVLFFLFYH